eukprot:6217098-Amphidinium_carterae.1
MDLECPLLDMVKSQDKFVLMPSHQMEEAAVNSEVSRAGWRRNHRDKRWMNFQSCHDLLGNVEPFPLIAQDADTCRGGLALL